MDLVAVEAEHIVCTLAWILIQSSLSRDIQPIGTEIQNNESQIFLFRVICCPTESTVGIKNKDKYYEC